MIAACALCALPSCGVGFDSAAQVEGLRVLGVKKSTPYAHPGSTVDFEMLYHDDTEQLRDVQILWLRGCQNPPADQVNLCFEVFSQVLKQAKDVPPPPKGKPSEEALAQLVTSLQGAFDPAALAQAAGVGPAQAGDLGMAAPGSGFGTFELGFGETFQLTVAPDIISSREPPKDPKLPPYGVEYVFALACAGQLWIDTSRQFPIGCFDSKGKQVDPSRYVVGYSKLWVYDELENDNPLILGMKVDGKRLADDQLCIDEACQTLSPADAQGVDCPRSRTLSPCKDEDKPGTCPKLPVEVVVDENSVNDDPVLSSLQETPVSEQMWVNYYTDKGAFTQDLALINDDQSGFNPHPDTDFLSPEETGVARVWAVVHDNRGGVSWARFNVCVSK
jgi:hypothetical protein